MQMGKTKVKVCGLTRKEEAEMLADCRVEFAGMVLFFPKSKRNVTLQQAEQILAALKKYGVSKSVAVTVSPTKEQVEQIMRLGFDYIQIHGELSDDVYNACSVRIIRAVNIKHQSEEDIYLETKRWQSLDKIYGLLFDAGVPGSGKTFDWESLKKADCGNKKLFLAGGLTPDNVKAAIEAVRPDVVDISSGVEYDDVSVKGKDESKVKAFIQNAKY